MSWTITPRFTQWTPANISTALWLDANDASTITTVSGAVSQWNDKSGNGRNATQATAGSRPAYSSTGFNSRPGITFDGTDDWMTVGGSSISGSGYHYAMVIRPNANAISSVNGDAVFWLRNSYDFNGFLHILFRSNIASKFRSFISSDGNVGSLNIQYLTSNATATEQIVTFGGMQTNLWLNGTLQANASSSTVANNTITYSSLLAEIGRYYDTTNVFNGAFSVAEFILITSSANAEIVKLEGYLAHKWGLTANLPAGHPYKVNPPAP